MEHLSLWHDGRFAECIYLQTALMNMLMRHFVAREVKLRLMNSKFVRETIAEEVFQPNFKPRMKKAIAAPDSPDAKKLRKMFEKIIILGTGECPYSPGERKNVLPKLYANNFFFGLPTAFNTIAPDNFMAVKLLRKCISPKYESPALTDSSEASMNELIDKLKEYSAENNDPDPYKLVPSNPVRAAMYFNQTLNATALNLYGIQWSTSSKKTVAIEARENGIFSKATNACGVNEVGGRSQFHAHHLVHGGINATVLTEIAEYPELVAAAAAALNTQHLSEISIAAHENHIKRGIKPPKGTDLPPKPVRCSLREIKYVLLPNGDVDPEFEMELDERVGVVNNHVPHQNSCKQGPHGRIVCRYKKPSGINNEGTRPIELEEVYTDDYGNEIKVDHSKKKSGDSKIKTSNVGEKIDENMIIKTLVRETKDSSEGTISPLIRMLHDDIGKNRFQPFPPLDNRNLVWETRRRGICFSDDALERAHDFLKFKGLLDVEYEYGNGDPGPINYHGSILFNRNVNGRIVDFNRVQTMALGCNTSCNHMGSEEQARNGMFYIGDYFGKDGVAISNALSYALTAKEICDRYPGKTNSHEVFVGKPPLNVNNGGKDSIVNDNVGVAGTNNDVNDTNLPDVNESTSNKNLTAKQNADFFRAKKNLNCFLNHINGGAQMAITQCAAGLLRFPSFRSSHPFWGLWIDSASEYVRAQYELLGDSNEIEEDEDDEFIHTKRSLSEIFADELERKNGKDQLHDTSVVVDIDYDRDSSRKKSSDDEQKDDSPNVNSETLTTSDELDIRKESGVDDIDDDSPNVNSETLTGGTDDSGAVRYKKNPKINIDDKAGNKGLHKSTSFVSKISDKSISSETKSSWSSGSLRPRMPINHSYDDEEEDEEMNFFDKSKLAADHREDIDYARNKSYGCLDVIGDVKTGTSGLSAQHVNYR